MRTVKFKGNKHFTKLRLKDETSIQSSWWLKEKILRKEPFYYTQKLYNDDIKRLKIFYQKEGYLNVNIGEPEITLTKKDRLKIIIPIFEGKPIRISDVSILVDSTYTLEDVTRYNEKKQILYKSETATSKIFRDQAVLNDKELITELFYNKGYPYTSVSHKLNVDTATNTTKLQWTVERGPLSYFGSTKINGNSRVPSKSILRQLAYKEGEVWSKKKIDQSQKQIYNQGNYRVASLRTQMDTTLQDTLPIQIHINEAPRWTTRFGVGYGREDKFRVFTDIQYLSFITNTGRLNFYAKHSYLEPYHFYLKFSQPSFLFPINTLSIYPFAQSLNEPGYELDKKGINISFLQNFSKELNTSIGFIYEDVETDTTNIDEIEDPEEIESIYKKSGIVIGGIYNNAKPILDPVTGYVISFNTKTNDIILTEEMPFIRFLTEFKTYFGIRKGAVMALKAKIGGIDRTDDMSYIPIDERFFAGGSQSVRGWGRSELGPTDEDGNPTGGNSLFETSAEIRMDIGKKMKLAAFVDAGNVWEEPFTYKLNELRYSAGVGIRMNTAIGPTGLDFARPIFDEEDKWQIHFNIGYAF